MKFRNIIHQLLEETYSPQVDMTKVVNKFIEDPQKFIQIFSLNTDKPHHRFIRFSLAIAKFLNDFTKNTNQLYNNLKVYADGVDVSDAVKKLIYPSDVRSLITNKEEFLNRMERRINQRRRTAMTDSEFQTPYNRLTRDMSKQELLKVMGADTTGEYTYSQYELVQADLDLELIKYIKSDELIIDTDSINGEDDDNKNNFIRSINSGIKGEELLDIYKFDRIKNMVMKIWKDNKQHIFAKYNEVKQSNTNQVFVDTLELLFI